MHDIDLRVNEILQFSNLKPRLVKYNRALFSAFSMDSNVVSDRLSAHAVSWTCVYSPQGAAVSVFNTFGAGGSKIFSHFQILLDKIACSYGLPALTYDPFSPKQPARPSQRCSRTLATVVSKVSNETTLFTYDLHGALYFVHIDNLCTISNRVPC